MILSVNFLYWFSWNDLFNVFRLVCNLEVLRPVQKMAKVAEGISAQHLSERLEVEHTPTELKSLAIAFNDMLGQTRISFRKKFRFFI